MITIAETEVFHKKSRKLLLPDEILDLVSYLSENPNAGVLIQGSGGVRKIRWSKGDSGKSGGVRIIYYYYNETIPLYLLSVFAKNEKANISKEEKNILAKLVKELVNYWKNKDE